MSVDNNNSKQPNDNADLGFSPDYAVALGYDKENTMPRQFWPKDRDKSPKRLFRLPWTTISKSTGTPICFKF